MLWIFEVCVYNGSATGCFRAGPFNGARARLHGSAPSSFLASPANWAHLAYLIKLKLISFPFFQYFVSLYRLLTAAKARPIRASHSRSLDRGKTSKLWFLAMAAFNGGLRSGLKLLTSFKSSVTRSGMFILWSIL